jgi:transcription antitermination factor NusG
VIRIVGSGKGISRIDDHEIEAIRAVAECEVNVRPYRHLTVGSKGRVVKGALAGIEGIVITHKNHRRLVLSLDLIQSSIAIDVDRCEVELTSCTEKCGEPRHVLFPATQSRAI